MATSTPRLRDSRGHFVKQYNPTVLLMLYPGIPPFSWIVHFVTNSPFGHVGVRIGDTIYEALVGGVISRPYDKFGRDRNALPLEIPTDSESRNIVEAEIWLKGQIGKAYDWSADWFDLFGFLAKGRLKLVRRGGRRWNCSRLASTFACRLGWSKTGVERLKDPITPGDIYRLIVKDRRERKH